MLLLVAYLLIAVTSIAAPNLELLVCADPNNLPFSDDKRQGFENRIAEIVAGELGMEPQYLWWAQRRGFVRQTLGSGRCDVIIGVPATLQGLLTTKPYYRSSYVFVTRKESGLQIHSFDDPALRKVRIGVQLIGEDYNNTPPAHALSRRGIVSNVSGYRVAGDYSVESPPSLVVKAVADGEVDVAVAWGPLAGYYAKRSPVALRVVPVSPAQDSAALPFEFDISMGVRSGNTDLKVKLEHALVRRRAEIDGVLREYGVPIVGVRK